MTRFGAVLLIASAIAGCSGGDRGDTTGGDAENQVAGVTKSPAKSRATRRAYDGAPPVIPHDKQSAQCTECHNRTGIEVEGLGFAPPSPHASTAGLSDRSRCRQCHVFSNTDGEFTASKFVGLAQDLRHGSRAYPGAPPVMPHPIFMRENCLACHGGQAAREEIRTSHPERVRCNQCHVPVLAVNGPFQSE